MRLIPSKDCLDIATGVIITMRPNPKMLMKALALCPEMLATGLAYYLVRKGVLNITITYQTYFDTYLAQYFS